jgi:hypothetical protein
VVTRNRIAIVAMTAATLGVLILQSLLHGHLSGIDEYDDGVYLGSSLDLIHGIMPYRDFAFIQPPMAAVWLLPFAALSFLTGTAHALEAARIFIDLIAAANVAMVGIAVRRRPTPQVLVAMGMMATYPATVMSAQALLLEPLLVFGCLAATACLFDGNQITASRRRILAAGVLFGVAGATKLWAALPFAAAVIVTWPAGPVARRRLVAGGAAGPAAPGPVARCAGGARNAGGSAPAGSSGRAPGSARRSQSCGRNDRGCTQRPRSSLARCRAGACSPAHRPGWSPRRKRSGGRVRPWSRSPARRIRVPRSARPEPGRRPSPRPAAAGRQGRIGGPVPWSGMKMSVTLSISVVTMTESTGSRPI